MRASLEDRQREMQERLGCQRKIKKRPALSERQRKMRARIFKTTMEGRFKENIDKHGPVHYRLGTRCWIWTGKKNNSGYGHMQVDGRPRAATHILWYLRHGEWPSKGRLACHHCDNPPCINPTHLYLGTSKSNMRDMHERGRWIDGSENIAKDVRIARAKKGGLACLSIHGREFFQAIARKKHDDARKRRTVEP